VDWDQKSFDHSSQPKFGKRSGITAISCEGGPESHSIVSLAACSIDHLSNNLQRKIHSNASHIFIHIWNNHALKIIEIRSTVLTRADFAHHSYFLSMNLTFSITNSPRAWSGVNYMSRTRSTLAELNTLFTLRGTLGRLDHFAGVHGPHWTLLWHVELDVVSIVTMLRRVSALQEASCWRNLMFQPAVREDSRSKYAKSRGDGLLHSLFI
jgi:hypothetical protein